MAPSRKKIKIENKSQSASNKKAKQEKKEDDFLRPSFRNMKEVQKKSTQPTSKKKAKQEEKEDIFMPTSSRNMKEGQKEDKCQPSSSGSTKQENKKDKCPPKTAKNTKQQKNDKCPSTFSTNQENKENKCRSTSLTNTKEEMIEGKCLSKLSESTKEDKKFPSTKSPTSSKDQNVASYQKKKQMTTSSKVSKNKKYPPMVAEYPKFRSYPLAKDEDPKDDGYSPQKKRKYIPVPKEKVKQYFGGAVAKLSHESFVRSYCKFQQNGFWNSVAKSIHRDVLIREMASMQPIMRDVSFQRRCTALAWHPSDSQLLAVASKGGEILMCRTLGDINYSKMITGVGPGGSILALQISKNTPTLLYAASMEGFINSIDYENQKFTPLLKMANFDYRNWYTSLCVDEDKNVAVIGDTFGKLSLVDLKSHKLLLNEKLHRGKLLHLELSNRDSNLLVTSSIDHTAKLWDLRKLTNKNDFLVNLEHEKAVNSSYFSLKSGDRLLTTDQDHELRVYSAPLWKLERAIIHPHRQFQHMTSIKAHWHPFEDIIVAGRYPDRYVPSYDDKFRCIDFIDAASDKLLFELASQKVTGITSLCQFNYSGDILASTTGAKLILWSSKIE